MMANQSKCQQTATAVKAPMRHWVPSRQGCICLWKIETILWWSIKTWNFSAVLALMLRLFKWFMIIKGKTHDILQGLQTSSGQSNLEIWPTYNWSSFDTLGCNSPQDGHNLYGCIYFHENSIQSCVFTNFLKIQTFKICICPK